MYHYNGGGPTLDTHLGSYYPTRDTSTQTVPARFNDITSSSQMNYTLVGIVAKEISSDKYVVADHISNADTLVIYDTETETRRYVSINFGPQRPEGAPGTDLIEYLKENYPDLEILITGRKLIADTGKIKNETAEPDTDIEDIIKDYKAESEETTEDSEGKEYDMGSNEDYDPEASDVKSDSAGELVGVAVEGGAETSEGESSESSD